MGKGYLMIPKRFLSLLSVICSVSILLSVIVMAGNDGNISPKIAPTNWFTDDYQNNNDLLLKLDDTATKNKEKIKTDVVFETETNKVLSVSKNASYSSDEGDPNITVFPRLPNGDYAYIGDESDGAIKVTPNKTYKYVVEFKYKLVSTSGAYGVYLSACVAEKNTNTIKNSKTAYILNNTLNTTTIGDYSSFNTLAKLGEWNTISLDTSYISTDGLSKPVMALNFKVAKAFKGELLIDDVCVRCVDENDTTSTVIFNPNNKNETRYNPVSYVTGAKYKLPVPTKSGYEFVGWYADTNYSILCEDALPENQIKDSYSVLTARWIENTLTDDFDQKKADNRIVSGNLALVKGEGMYDTTAMKYTHSNMNDAVFIPKNLKGKDYVLKANAKTEYKYLAQFSYKADKSIGESGVDISFDLVKSGTSQSINSKSIQVFEVNSARGNADSTWRKATLALRFTANKTVDANIAVRISSKYNSEILIDGIVITETVSEIGSFSFVGDDYTGYFETVAGEFGKQVELDIPNRNGHTFAGWQNSSGTPVVTSSFGKTDEILYPKWEKLSAPTGTTELITDDFDQTVPVERGKIPDCGLDTSNWEISTFEQFGSKEFDKSKVSNYNFSDKKYSLSVESEDDGNHYLHIVNNGGNSTDLRHLLWFLDEKDNIIGQINQGSSRSGTFIVSYKFKYKINNNTEDSYGLYMKSALIRSDNNNNFTQKETFALTGAHKPSEEGSVYYGLSDGNWHIASYSAAHTVDNANRNKSLIAGFWMDICNRKIDVCLDDISIKIDYYTNSVGSKTATNIKFNSDYLSDDNKIVAGPEIDVVTANYGKSVTLPTPYAPGKVFLGWELNNKDFDANNVSISRPTTGYIVLKAKYRERKADDPLISTFNQKVINNSGIGKTSALRISATAPGNGLINLKDKEGLSFKTFLKSNDNVNWIVRLRYNAKSVPDNGISLNFDISENNSGVSLSNEGGTQYKFCFGGNSNNDDGTWHTAYFPVSLTRNDKDPLSAVTLLINLSSTKAFSELLLEEVSLFDAGDKNVSGYFFNGKYFVDPIAGIVGNNIKLPTSPNPAYSIGKWYKDEKFLNVFGNPNDTVKISSDVISLYADFLTPDGYYAVENFENSIDIWEKQANTRGAAYKKIYDDNENLIGKMRSFQIVDNPDETGKCLKYDIDGENDTYSTILLTDSQEDQIYLGSKKDEDEQIYIVKFRYKVDRADTELKFSLGGCNYNAMWESNSYSSDTVVFPVLSKTNGWQEMAVYLPISWKKGSAGDNAENIYASFTITGQGLVWVDDVRYIKVYSGLAESIYFDTDEGGFIAPYTGVFGETIPKLPIPKKIGYKFLGWYTDYSFETKFTRTVFGGDGTDPTLFGTNYLYASYEKIEETSTDNGEDSLTEVDDSFEVEPVYELRDITEEITTTKYRTKTRIEKRKVGETGGVETWLIILIIVGCVILVAGAIVFFIVRKKRR